jgi:hypothetical protein
MVNSIIQISDVDILVNGKPVKKYTHQGKVFVEAKHGTEYTIKIKNSAWDRRLAVAAVDGINVIDGSASGSSQAGYIINGLNSYEIKGFRTSNDAVNAFKFSVKEKSYAAKAEQTQGDTTNCGVIGVRVYTEKTQPVKHVMIPYNPWPYPEPYSPDPFIPDPIYEPFKPIWISHVGSSMNSLDCSSTVTVSNQSSTTKCIVDNPTRSASRRIQANSLNGPNPTLNFFSVIEEDKQGFDMGTEFSDKEINDSVKEVDFDVGYLEHTWEIYYASKESLIQMGVPVEREALVTFPKAFPSKFCKPPKK